MTEPKNLPQRQQDQDPELASASATQLSVLMGAATATVEEEFKRSERLDSKSRNQVTVTGSFYAVVQAIVIGLLNGVLRAHSGKLTSFAPWLAGLAIASGVLMVLAVAASYQSWKLRDEEALDIDTIRQYIPHAAAGRKAVGVNLVKVYADIAAERRTVNSIRARALDRAALACGAALFVAGGELAVAFVAVAVR